MSAVDETSASLFRGRLSKAIEPLQQALTNHAVYRRLSLRPAVRGETRQASQTGNTNQSGEYRLGLGVAQVTGRGVMTRPSATDDALLPLRVFMESHVFAVWDFMSLVKTLQQRLTCVRTPWQPPADPTSARLINEIVLVEETDEFGKERYASHFELYLQAMDEISANTRPVRTFLAELRAGTPVAAALARTHIPASTKAFAMNTMSTLNRGTHEVAASFLLGREAVIPLMFEQVLDAISKIEAPTLSWYLKRHIEVDGDEHGPAGWRLLERLCGTDANRWAEAEACAKRALFARRALWDGVCRVLDARLNSATTAAVG